MSHEISVQNGKEEAMYALQPAWHGLGTVVDHVPHSEEAIKLAGLDWDVEQWPVFGIHQGTGIQAEVEDKQLNIRSDNHRPLGVVGTNYKPVQNIEAFNFLDSLVEDGVIRYESAGALKDGRVIWLLARMPKEFTVTDDDACLPYILFANSHDGSMAVRVLPTSVRVVCQNTLSMALGGRGKSNDRELRIAHRGNIQAKIKSARKIMGIVDSKFELYMRQAEDMAKKSITSKVYDEYLEKLFPTKDGSKNSRAQNIRDVIKDIMEEQTSQTKGSSGTWWGAFNTVTQYVDHDMTIRGKDNRGERRMCSVLFDHGARVKRQALDTALEMSGVS